MSIEKDQQQQRTWLKKISWNQLKNPKTLKFIFYFGITIYRTCKFLLDLFDRG